MVSVYISFGKVESFLNTYLTVHKQPLDPIFC